MNSVESIVPDGPAARQASVYRTQSSPVTDPESLVREYQAEA
jgi:hypothetical protein